MALWAYAYEIIGESLVDDKTYDEISLEINTKVPTDRPDLDIWFIQNFEPYTGQWVHKHPELDRLEALYNRVKHIYTNKKE